jgi:hypothetical protein
LRFYVAGGAGADGADALQAWFQANAKPRGLQQRHSFAQAWRDAGRKPF